MDKFEKNAFDYGISLKKEPHNKPVIYEMSCVYVSTYELCLEFDLNHTELVFAIDNLLKEAKATGVKTHGIYVRSKPLDNGELVREYWFEIYSLGFLYKVLPINDFWILDGITDDTIRSEIKIDNDSLVFAAFHKDTKIIDLANV